MLNAGEVYSDVDLLIAGAHRRRVLVFLARLRTGVPLQLHRRCTISPLRVFRARVGIKTLQGGVVQLAELIGRTKPLEPMMVSEPLPAEQLAARREPHR
jgi:hypothetical protein